MSAWINDNSRSAREIVGEELNGIDVESDGSRFRIGITCPENQRVVLSLPAGCLQALIMTLPSIMARALRARYRDDSLRLVYPADKVCIERSSDPKNFIVTMATPDGFSVSFGLSGEQMNSFERLSSSLKARVPGATTLLLTDKDRPEAVFIEASPMSSPYDGEKAEAEFAEFADLNYS